MSIDKQKLKAAALAIGEVNSLEDLEADEAMFAFEVLATPSAVLALLAEIERLGTWRTAFLAEREAQIRQRDQLQAENEALRTGQAIKRLSCAEVREAFNGAYYQPSDIGSDGEQCRAGVLAVIEAASAKGVGR